MHNTIRRYVASCHTCRRAKTSRETYNGLLKPLPVPDRRWKDISVDFVVDLPASKGCTNIMVVVDRLSKMRHLIACPDMSAPAVAQLFLDHVWKLHGLPETIISDRGRQFISAFWKELTARLRVTALLSTAFHPETDGQTERVNAVMEQYIRIYTSYLQDDWMNWLAFAEFTANNSVSETTKVSPFLANYGQHPRMGFEPSTNAPYPAYQALQVAEADKFVKKMEELQQFLTDEMTWA
jgi:transposase InsO family protein